MSDKKIALVTGGTGGIGTAICKTLIKDGLQVVAGFYQPEEVKANGWQQQMQTDGFMVKIVGGDVADYASAGKMIAETEKIAGEVSVLVNCAGITRDKMLKGMSQEQWNAVIKTNLDSAFNMSQQIISGMLERGFGRIINISSVNGQKGQFGQANYSAAKAGLHGFTMAVAQETALKGITVNTISPGYIATEMTKAIRPDILESITETIPMRRMGEPEEIANAVSWLASTSAGYVTGANIPVNGGLFMAA